MEMTIGRFGRLVLGVFVTFSLGCQRSAASQCSKWEVVFLDAMNLEHGTSEIPPGPKELAATKAAREGADALADLAVGMTGDKNLKGTIAEARAKRDGFLGQPHALPEGWEPVGALGVTVMVRRCVR